MNRKKLFVIITSITAVSIVAGGFAASEYVRSQLVTNLINQYSNQESLVASQISQILVLEIAQTQSKLNLIAKLPDVMSGNTAACNKKLKEIFDDPQTKVGNLGRVGPDGFFKCSLNAKLIGIKAETLGTYIKDIFNDPAHKAVMSRAIKPPGAASYVVAIHVPVWDADGKFIGTLGGAVYLSDLEKLYIKNVALAPGGHISLFDDDGTILYHYKPELIGLNLASPQYQQFVRGGLDPQKAIEDIKNGVSGTLRFSFDNDQKIAAFVPAEIFAGRKWRVSITVPVKAAQDSIVSVGIDRLLTELPLILGAIVLVIFPFFVWLVARRVFHPMEEIDKVKSEFVSLASHQLRTPLSAINWYTETLLAGDAGPVNDEQKKYLHEIYDGNHRMVDLVNALLNVSRLDLGTFAVDPEPTDFIKMAQSVIDEQAQQVAAKKIQLATSFDKNIPIIPADPKLLRIILQNFLSNAIKYTPDEGKIYFALSLEGRNVLIKVADTGYGIRKNQQDKIFSKLFRADNVREKSTEGTGLGLYIVKAIVEESGGKVWFESEEDKGSTFYALLPVEGMKKKGGSKGLS